MKTKARDIVAGWPCGRSTTVVSTNRHWQWFDAWPFITRISIAMNEQLSMDRIYHQMQQAMVNEWFARYRLGDKQFEVIEQKEGTCPQSESYSTEEN